jgi:hypothetical protein
MQWQAENQQTRKKQELDKQKDGRVNLEKSKGEKRKKFGSNKHSRK